MPGNSNLLRLAARARTISRSRFRSIPNVSPRPLPPVLPSPQRSGAADAGVQPVNNAGHPPSGAPATKVRSSSTLP